MLHSYSCSYLNFASINRSSSTIRFELAIGSGTGQGDLLRSTTSSAPTADAFRGATDADDAVAGVETVDAAGAETGTPAPPTTVEAPAAVVEAMAGTTTPPVGLAPIAFP